MTPGYGIHLICMKAGRVSPGILRGKLFRKAWARNQIGAPT